MLGVSGGAAGGAEAAATATSVPLQTASVSAILDASGPVRGLAAFVLVSVLGALLLWRYEPFVERSIDASMERPLSSLAYGVAAHAVIAFGGVYLVNQLTNLEAYGWNAGSIGVLVGLLVVLLAASLGFVVVGSTVVEFAWGQSHWYGLVVGALVAGVAGFLGSFAGGTLWFVVVSMGIGGPARNWLHADEVRAARRSRR
ncbi:MAG TPA: hypothetical protein VKA37_06865 [Halobacteriales archaeon]|nr:hypothetical protein [Halobacteriales archaeon]